MKKTYLGLGVVVVLVLAVGGVLLLQGSSKADSECQGAANTRHFSVTIRDGKVDNDHVQGKLCDSMTITNRDAISREIAFGPHEDHVPYDGIAERVVNKDQSLTVTFNKSGSYHWHDHIHDEVEGYFTVTK